MQQRFYGSGPGPGPRSWQKLFSQNGWKWEKFSLWLNDTWILFCNPACHHFLLLLLLTKWIKSSVQKTHCAFPGLLKHNCENDLFTPAPPSDRSCTVAQRALGQQGSYCHKRSAHFCIYLSWWRHKGGVRRRRKRNCWALCDDSPPCCLSVCPSVWNGANGNSAGQRFSTGRPQKWFAEMFWLGRGLVGSSLCSCMYTVYIREIEKHVGHLLCRTKTSIQFKLQFH